MSREYLQSCIENDQLATSYIFTGKKGLGKEALATQFVKMLFGVSTSGAAQEQVERKVDDGNHPDLKIVGSDKDEKSIKIETVREIQEWLRYKPFESKLKVVVVVNVERMTVQAQNAFLKTLEEPPKDSLVLLTTHNAIQLIPTVLSRLTEVRLTPLSKSELLRQLGDEKGLKGKESFVAYHADGSLDEAKAILESNLLDLRDEIFGLFFESDLSGFFNYFDQKTKIKGNTVLKDSIELLKGLLRDILIIKSNESISEDLLIHGDYHEASQHFARIHSRQQVLEAYKKIQHLRQQLESNANPKLVSSNLGVVLNQF